VILCLVHLASKENGAKMKSATEHPWKHSVSNGHLFAIVLMSLLASPPFAATASSTVTPALAHDAGENEVEADEQSVRRELELFHDASISLVQAITIVRNLDTHSRIADVAFDGASGQPIYRVRTFQNDRVLEYTIDARTGDLRPSDHVCPKGAQCGGSGQPRCSESGSPRAVGPGRCCGARSFCEGNQRRPDERTRKIEFRDRRRQRRSAEAGHARTAQDQRSLTNFALRSRCGPDCGRCQQATLGRGSGLARGSRCC
jgi:uncharacterized membrane protein YkoI